MSKPYAVKPLNRWLSKFDAKIGIETCIVAWCTSLGWMELSMQYNILPSFEWLKLISGATLIDLVILADLQIFEGQVASSTWLDWSLSASWIAAALACAACRCMTAPTTVGQTFHGFGRYGSRYCGCSRWNGCRSSLGMVENLCKSWTSDWRCALARPTLFFCDTLCLSHWLSSLVEGVFGTQSNLSCHYLQQIACQFTTSKWSEGRVSALNLCIRCSPVKS